MGGGLVNTGAGLVHGDALRIPLADRSVNLVVTSPPYWELRSYQDGGEHYAGQIGSEPTPTEFLLALWAVADECWRVLADSGSAWFNLGDKYSDGKARDVRAKSLSGMPWRFMMGLIMPELYRAPFEPSACWHDDGPGPCRTCPPRVFPKWIGRAEVVWSKPNGLPESVADRPRRSHEQWFMVTKQPRYFAAVDEVREDASRAHHGHRSGPVVRNRRDDGQPSTLLSGFGMNPLGKLPGSVRSVPSEPLRVPDHLGVDHFAAFPSEWPRWIIAGWSPSGICTACGEGRRPVRGVDWSKVPHRMERKRVLTDAERAEFAAEFRAWQDGAGIPSKQVAALFPSATGGLTGCVANWRHGYNVLTPEQAALLVEHFGPLPARLHELVHLTRLVPVALFEVGTGPDHAGRHRNSEPGTRPSGYVTITGYACACPDTTAPTKPAVILDPFVGTGTVPMMARVMGRYGVGIDLSRDYLRLARWRIWESGHGEKRLAKTDAERNSKPRKLKAAPLVAAEQAVLAFDAEGAA